MTLVCIRVAIFICQVEGILREFEIITAIRNNEGLIWLVVSGGRQHVGKKELRSGSAKERNQRSRRKTAGMTELSIRDSADFAESSNKLIRVN